MTNSQAKSELMQIYGMLSEEKKQALDVLMAQNCDQCEVGNPCLYCEYEFKAQEDGEKVFKMRDATPEERESIDKYIKSISKPTGLNFWDLADGEYISRQAVIDSIDKWVKNMGVLIALPAQEVAPLFDSIHELPSVDISPEHDGCKDCKYETYPEYYYPCCECKHNYNDFWKFKPHWKPYLEEGLTVQCSECGSRFEIATKFCPRCGVYNGEEIERCKDD